MSVSLFVTKRDGSLQEVSFDKITHRIERIAKAHNLTGVCHTTVAQQTIAGLTNNIRTSDLDMLAANNAADLTATHNDYSKLAAAITVSNMHKMFNVVTGKHSSAYEERLRALLLAGGITQAHYDLTMRHMDFIVKTIQHERDYEYDYRGIAHLSNSILKRSQRGILETPQEMLMRVALAIFGDDLPNVARTYYLTSLGYYTHSTPTLLNAGEGNLSACFLLSFDTADNDELFEVLRNAGVITGMAGGLGIAISKIPVQGTMLDDGTTASGLCNYISILEDAVIYAQRGGAKRRGGLAAWIEPWHGEIMPFLSLKRNKDKKGEVRARSIFPALMACDLFLKRVSQDAMWSLFCPYRAPGLDTTYGEEFEKLYHRYEREGLAYATLPAREIWFAFMNCEFESGTPYLAYKDLINRTSNQAHLGVTRCLNLCSEITQYSSRDETAVCNLASISLKKFVVNGAFDHNLFADCVKHVTRALDKVIDVTVYPIESARRSNLRHRPMGIGIQGLADLFIELEIPYEPTNASKLAYEDYPALKLQTEIYETLYYAGLRASCDLARELGPHPSFPGSPASKGILHHTLFKKSHLSGRWDFDALNRDIVKYGRRNSYVPSQMPTAGTSIILGNNEGFEPYIGNVFNHKTISGEYLHANGLGKYLEKHGLWSRTLALQLIANDGSIQGIAGLPAEAYDIFKTVWEIKLGTIIRFAAARQPFLEQSQSLNIYLPELSKETLSTVHMRTWEEEIKTGCYYLKTRRTIKPAKPVEITSMLPIVPVSTFTPDSGSCSLNGSCGA